MALKSVLVRDDLRILGRLSVKLLKEELIFQQHVATGQLLDSINYRLESITGGLRMGVYAIPYSIFVDSGRKAGVTRVPIAPLIEWIKVKGIATDDKEAKSIAFAIQEKIFREGIPTSRSRRLAARRTRFIQIVKNRVQKEAREIVIKQVQDNVRSELNTWFRNAQKELNNGR